MTGLRNRALALAAVIGLGGLAACGSDTNQTENTRMAGESLKQIFSVFKRDKTVAAVCERFGVLLHAHLRQLAPQNLHRCFFVL